MRILRVLTRPNLGGPMRQAIALWHAHRTMGHETLLVTGQTPPEETVLGDDIPSVAQVDARCDGGHVTLRELGPGVHPIRDRVARRKLGALIDAFRPDVVHTHTSKAGFVGRGIARRRGVRVVAHTYHGLVLRDYFAAPMTWALRWLERRLARATDLNFAVSESCRRELDELGIRRVEVVPPAVDTRPVAASGGRVAARRALGVDEDAFVVGYVGRLVPIKRVEVFLELVDVLTDAVGVVLGDGPLRDRVIRHRGPRLRWLGADSRAPELLAGFDVLVLPSRREGFPVVAVEAAAAGVPCVGFDVPGVQDAVDASVAGAIVPSDAGVEALADAVRRVRSAKVRPDASVVELCDPRRVAECLIDRYRAMFERDE